MSRAYEISRLIDNHNIVSAILNSGVFFVLSDAFKVKLRYVLI